MSVELSFVVDGECDHGPKYAWEERTECNHRLFSPWGEVEYPDPDPGRDEVGHLVLAAGWWVGGLLGKGPIPGKRPGELCEAYTQDGRLFIKLAHENRTWTWELFEAHFADGKGPNDMLIGRWPD